MTDYTNLLERLAVSAGDQECLYADAKAAIEALQSRVDELESRLEISPLHNVDGIMARDATIKLQDERIAELEAERAEREKQEPVFQCKNCGGIYAEKVTQCDCMPEKQEWLEGVMSFEERPVTAPVRLTDEQAEKVDEAIREALGDAYDCLRVWNAWGYGTMGPDDFSQVAEDSDRVAEIRNAAAVALGFKVEE